LARIGDRDGLEAGIKFVTSEGQAALSAIDIDESARATYEGDIQFFWQTLATLSVDAQLRAIEYYDCVLPTDWLSERDEFLSQHKELARRYAESAKRKKEEQGTG